LNRLRHVGEPYVRAIFTIRAWALADQVPVEKEKARVVFEKEVQTPMKRLLTALEG